MNEPRVYTESEVGGVVGTVFNLMILDCNLRLVDVGRDQFVKGQRDKRENLCYGSTVDEQSNLSPWNMWFWEKRYCLECSQSFRKSFHCSSCQSPTKTI